MRHGIRLLTVSTTLVCAAALAGCGSKASSGAGVSAQSTAGTSVVAADAGAADPQAAANQDAKTLLDRFDAIPAASRRSSAPSGTPAALDYTRNGGNTADEPVLLSGWWTVAAPPASALAAAKALLPQWGAPHPAGLSSGGTTVTGYQVTSQSPGTLGDQDLTVQAAPLGNGSVLRVDVNVEWRKPRTAAETLPHAELLTVTESTVRTIGATPVVQRGTIRDAATIARITALINGLPNSPVQIPMFCPAEPATGTSLTLAFRDTVDAPVRAMVLVHARPRGACNGWVELTLGSSTHPVARLDDSLLPTPLDSQIAALAKLPAIGSAQSPTGR